MGRDGKERDQRSEVRGQRRYPLFVIRELCRCEVLDDFYGFYDFYEFYDLKYSKDLKDMSNGRQPKVDTHGVQPYPCSRQNLEASTLLPSPEVPVEVAVTHMLVPPSGQLPWTQ